MTGRKSAKMMKKGGNNEKEKKITKREKEKAPVTSLRVAEPLDMPAPHQACSLARRASTRRTWRKSSFQKAGGAKDFITETRRARAVFLRWKNTTPEQHPDVL